MNLAHVSAASYEQKTKSWSVSFSISNTGDAYAYGCRILLREIDHRGQPVSPYNIPLNDTGLSKSWTVGPQQAQDEQGAIPWWYFQSKPGERWFAVDQLRNSICLLGPALLDD